jgi:hypothetical protein
MQIEWKKTQGFIRCGITRLLVPPSFLLRRENGKNNELIHEIYNFTAILIADENIGNIHQKHHIKYYESHVVTSNEWTHFLR